MPTPRAVTRDDRIRVFVYGTLLAGESNHRLLASSERLGEHVTPARYTLYDTGPFPAAVTGGRTAIAGEVYAVTRRVFRQLDRLEDYPINYTRQRIDTPFGGAWIYLWIQAVSPRWRRLDGDWRRR